MQAANKSCCLERMAHSDRLRRRRGLPCTEGNLGFLPPQAAVALNGGELGADGVHDGAHALLDGHRGVGVAPHHALNLLAVVGHLGLRKLEAVRCTGQETRVWTRRGRGLRVATGRIHVGEGCGGMSPRAAQLHLTQPTAGSRNEQAAEAVPRCSAQAHPWTPQRCGRRAQ